MTKDKLCLSSKVVEISEREEYLELVNRLCYYDAPNLNGVVLQSFDAESRAKTLINMPVVAKYMTNAAGEPTFGGHELYIDSDGDISFGTDTIGTHIDAYVQEDSVDVFGEIKRLPCLFAKYRIWKRNKNVVAAIRRLFDLGKLYSSWEIAVHNYRWDDEEHRIITDYTFLANCLLGYEYAYPAYGEDAKGISLSQENIGMLMIAECLAKDKMENSNKGGDCLKGQKDKIIQAQNNEAVEPQTDIESKIKDILSNISENNFNVSFTINNEENATYTTYSLYKNGDVISESKLEGKLEDLEETAEIDVDKIVEGKDEQIAEQSDTIAKLLEKIQEINSQLTELNGYKEKFEEAERVRLEEEKQKQIAELKEYALSSRMFTAQELEDNEELNKMICELDRAGIQKEIAERVIAEVGTNKETKFVAAQANLSSETEGEQENQKINYRDFVNTLI